MRTIGILCSALVVLFAAAPSQAGMYGVNFSGVYGGDPENVTGTCGPPGAVQGGWNNVALHGSVNDGAGPGGPYTITDNDGLNPLTMTLAGNNDMGNGGNGGGTDDITRLLKTGICLGDVTEHVYVTQPYPGEYDVYVYAADGCRSNAYSVNGVGKNMPGGSWTTFVENTNYLVWTGVTGPLHITCNDGMGGFSITPEPATLALMGVGLAGALVRRKKV